MKRILILVVCLSVMIASQAAADMYCNTWSISCYTCGTIVSSHKATSNGNQTHTVTNTARYVCPHYTQSTLDSPATVACVDRYTDIQGANKSGNPNGICDTCGGSVTLGTKRTVELIAKDAVGTYMYTSGTSIDYVKLCEYDGTWYWVTAETAMRYPSRSEESVTATYDFIYIRPSGGLGDVVSLSHIYYVGKNAYLRWGTDARLISSSTIYTVEAVCKSTVTINPAGGYWNSSTSIQSFMQNSGTTLSIPVPTRTGYTFTGWTRTNTYGTMSSLTAAATYTFGSTGSVTDTLTAQWTVNSSTLTINVNGGSYSGTSPVTKNYGQTITIVNPSITNYTATFNSNGGSAVPSKTTNKAFSSWSVSGNAGTLSGTTFTFGTTRNGTGTLTANWSGSYAITLPAAPTKTGYTFSGWYNAASGGSKVGNAGASVTLSSNVTYYAQWTPNTYTVTWNTGTGVSTTSQTYDTSLNLPSDPTRTNSHFDGWWTAPTEGTRVTASTVYRTASNTTYYAHWIQTFSVTVPSVLPISVSPTGLVNTSTPTITNNSTGAVKCASISLTAINGWTLVPLSTDMSSVQVDSKKIGFEVVDVGNIPEGGSVSFTYNAVTSPTSIPYSNESALKVVFVFEWAST